MARKYREIDHSGDVGVEASGHDPIDALENLTRGLYALMVEGKVASRVERRLEVDAEGDGDMAVDWLNEVIAAASVYGEVYGEVRIERTGPHSVRGVIGGEPVAPGRHVLRFDVKAATYHGLVFERSGSGVRVRVIFDL